MSKLLDDVQYLAGLIGPRGTGTPAEAAAADFVMEQLVVLGLKPEKHKFRSVPSQNAFPIVISLLTLIAALIFLRSEPVVRWAAAAISFFAAISLWQTIRNSFNPIMFLIPKITSQNVEVRLPPKEVPRSNSGAGTGYRKAVILAHLDSNRCRLVWQSQAVSSIEPMTWLSLAVPLIMGAFYLVGAIAGGMLWWIISLPLLAFELGAFITLIRDDRTPYSPGAHDNAASVSVTLEVARRTISTPFKNTEIWFVFDGAEETDHAGVLDLLHRHGADLHDATFFGLEGLGSSELVYLTRQGICDHYRPTAGLVALVQSVALKHPEFKFNPAQMVAEDDVRTLRGRGYNAICIAARDPETGVLPHWHRPDDTPDTVSPEVMQRAADIMYAILKEIDI